MSSPWYFSYMKEPSSEGRCAGHPLNVEGMLEPWPSPAPSVGHLAINTPLTAHCLPHHGPGSNELTARH